MQSKMTQGKEWFEVVLHVYSGRSDPVWTVDETHPRFDELTSRLRRHSASQLPQRLGYRGFTVTRKHADITETGSLKTVTQAISGDPDLERFILSTAADIHEGVKKHAIEAINEHDDLEDDFQIIAERTGDDLPKYEPEKWNNPIHLTHNTSYNYCTDIMTDTNAKPGRATKHPFPEPPEGRYIEIAAESDGLKPVAAEDPNTIPEYEWNLVALSFWPPDDPQGNWDYHFYRIDSPGRHWSHKVGRTAATNLDNSGKLITDPRYCNRGPYTEFVGFMQTKKSKVSII